MQLFSDYATHVQGPGRDKHGKTGTKWGPSGTTKEPAGPDRDMQD